MGTPKVKKIGLFDLHFGNKNVEDLVRRCNRLSVLCLGYRSIRNNSLNSIIENLKSTLEELDISATDIDHEELVKLRSMPKLRVLRYSTEFMENCEIRNLTVKILPHVIINEKDI